VLYNVLALFAIFKKVLNNVLALFADCKYKKVLKSVAGGDSTVVEHLTSNGEIKDSNLESRPINTSKPDR